MSNINQTIREAMKNKRASLSDHASNYASQRIHQFLFQSDLFQQAAHIACYIDTKGEVRTDRIIKMILNANKHCYLPCLARSENDTKNTRELHFAEFTIDTPMIKNRFDIPEPNLAEVSLINLDQLDCVLLPLVAFDQKGNRLGMGSGYYDRTFFNNASVHHPLKLIGLAYDFQCSNDIQSFDHDVPLDAVITESGIITFK